MLSSEGVALRTLAAALLGGLALHRTEDLVSCGTVVYQSVMSWSTLTKLFSLQFALGFVHLWAAQTSLRALPPDILLHMATRQIDLSLGGAGTSFALHFLRTLERLRLLPPQPGLASRGVVFRAITTAIATLVSDSRLSPSHAGTEPNGNVLVVPAVQDPNPRATRGPDARPYHDHRPFAFANNFSGYKIPRRCRAALPAVAAFAFACEVFFPCVAPLLLSQTLHLVTGCILCPFGWIAELLVRVASVCTVDDSWTGVVLSFTCLPRFLAYVVAAVGVVLVLGVAATISFMGNVTTLISLLSTLRETGVRRRVTARLVMDPEAELEELLDDQEMSYSIEDLKLDVDVALLCPYLPCARRLFRSAVGYSEGDSRPDRHQHTGAYHVAVGMGAQSPRVAVEQRPAWVRLQPFIVAVGSSAVCRRCMPQCSCRAPRASCVHVVHALDGMLTHTPSPFPGKPSHLHTY
jgi:hypothetical protein